MKVRAELDKAMEAADEAKLASTLEAAEAQGVIDSVLEHGKFMGVCIV